MQGHKPDAAMMMSPAVRWVCGSVMSHEVDAACSQQTEQDVRRHVCATHSPAAVMMGWTCWTRAAGGVVR